MIGNEAEHTLAAGILQRPARIVELEGLVDLEHFTEKLPRGVFQVATRYHRARGGANSLDVALARSLLEQSDSSGARALLPVVEEYARLELITEAEFRDAVGRVRDARRKNLTKARATEALEAALAGDDDKARDLMRRGLLEAGDAEDDRPTDIRSAASFEEELRELKKPATSARRFDIGFRFVTDRAGAGLGRLTVLAGYAKDGKSQWAKTTAYNAMMLSGARALYTSLEMTKPEVRCLIVCAHAATIDPRGVPWASILDKTASRDDRRLYARALLDLKIAEGAGDDPDRVGTKDGGTVIIWCPRQRPTVGHWRERLAILQREQDVNMAVADYLELFRPTRRTGEYRHDLTEMAYEFKDAATAGKGAWVQLLHQINRAGRVDAEKRSPRCYLMRDLKESSGIEAAATSIWWIFTDEVLKSDLQARAGVAANRMGESLIEGTEVHFNPRIGVVAELDDVTRGPRA